MSTITKVEITGGNVTVEIEITYRPWIPGDDPWKRVSGASTDFPAGGSWENRMMNGSTKQIRLYNDSEGSIATLDKCDRVTVGSTGSGTFLASGYTITQYSSIDWKILSVK